MYDIKELAGALEPTAVALNDNGDAPGTSSAATPYRIGHLVCQWRDFILPAPGDESFTQPSVLQDINYEGTAAGSGGCARCCRLTRHPDPEQHSRGPCTDSRARIRGLVHQQPAQRGPIWSAWKQRGEVVAVDSQTSGQ